MLSISPHLRTQVPPAGPAKNLRFIQAELLVCLGLLLTTASGSEAAATGSHNVIAQQLSGGGFLAGVWWP